MKVHHIKIKNFRCFGAIPTEISFGSQTTVFIGKNGTGKSSIIAALKSGLSFLFAKNKDFINNLHNSGINLKPRGFEFWDARFNEMERKFHYPISVELSGDFDDQPLSWELYKEDSGGKYYSSKYNQAQHLILAHYNQDVENAKLPLLAFYSDSYPHILSNVGSVAKNIVLKDTIPRDFGYYGWDETTNCMHLWQMRYKKISKYIRDYQIDLERIEHQIKQLSEKHSVNNEAILRTLKKRLESIKNDKNITPFSNELEFIGNKIFKLTEPLRSGFDFINPEFQIVRLLSNKPSDGAEDSLEFIFSNGSSIFFEMLPQGYKRVFSIAIDLAYRSYFLNKTADFDGIVFIDEIELHLHPSLQQEILQRFTNTFPKLQFIVTTHSVSVISNLKADGVENKMLKLKKDGLEYSNEPVENIFGIDYSTGLIDIMGAKYRPSLIDSLMDSYVILKLRNKTEYAQQIWDEIFAIVGTDNEVIKKEINEKIEANRAS